MRIAIVGGGPAGAMAAHKLGQAGAEVTLFDKRGAWEKPCGGGVPPKVMEMIPEMAAYGGDKLEVSVGEFVSPKGLPVFLESRNPMWIMARKDLNGYLLGLARSHKTVTFKKQAVKKLTENGNGFTVHAMESEKFDFVIGADGCRSKVGRLVGRAIPPEFITMCTGVFVESLGEHIATSWFLQAPGYIWAFPRNDHICVGGGSADPRLSISTYTTEVIEKRFSGRKIIAKWAAPIPFIRDPAFYDRTISGSNWAVIGDAAGHVDALTGEGILYALLGGTYIAQSIIEGDPSLLNQRWRDQFGAQLKKASQLSAKFYKPGMMDKIFRIAHRSPTMRNFLMEIMADQPSYLEAGKKFSFISWKIFLESIRGKS